MNTTTKRQTRARKIELMVHRLGSNPSGYDVGRLLAYVHGVKPPFHLRDKVVFATRAPEDWGPYDIPMKKGPFTVLEVECEKVNEDVPFEWYIFLKEIGDFQEFPAELFKLAVTCQKARTNR